MGYIYSTEVRVVVPPEMVIVGEKTARAGSSVTQTLLTRTVGVNWQNVFITDNYSTVLPFCFKL